MLRVTCYVLLVVSCLLVVGCARTVTQIVTYGDRMAVEVTLRGTMEVNDDRYFLVLASSSNYQVPLPSPNLNENCPEFIEPGMTPSLGTAEAYYGNFFITWAGYIVLDSAGYSYVTGPFVSGQTVTREVLSSLGEISNKIKFNFGLSQIFGNAVPATIYFDFISVPWPAASAKIPADHLVSTNAYISKVAGSTIIVTDEEDDTLGASLDIIKCTVTIQ